MLYKDTYFPDNALWEQAFSFGTSYALGDFAAAPTEETINRYCVNHIIHPAKLLGRYCPDPSEASVALALMGSMKEAFAGMDEEEEALLRGSLNDATVDLGKAYAGVSPATPEQARDIARVRMAEGLCLMDDQLIGMKKDDARLPANRFLVQQFNLYTASFVPRAEAPVLEEMFRSKLREAARAIPAAEQVALGNLLYTLAVRPV